MAIADPEKAEIRIDWASHVRNVCQAAVGDLLDGEQAGPARAASRLLRHLPACSNEADSAVLREILLRFVDKAAAFADRRFHARFEQRPCLGPVPAECEQHWLDPQRDLRSLLLDWPTHYEQWFGSCHALPAAVRARQWLEANPCVPIDVNSLARRVGTSRRALETHFAKYFGVTVAEYARQVRIAEGMRRLRAGGESVEDTARAVGYQSANKFYARLFEYCGLKPSEVQTMDAAAFESLVAALTACRGPAPNPKSPASTPEPPDFER